jgi:hypothetical protein
MRDRLRILGVLLAIPLLGLSSPKASAGAVSKKTAKKKTTKKKAKKKVAKKKVAKKTPTRVSEPRTLALMGTGLVAAGVAHKLGRRSKKKS